MRNIVAIMQRELLSQFCSPAGYIVIAGFLLITGASMVWNDSFEPGQEASLRNVFLWTPWVLTVIIPAITMRALSEEYRGGTIETLMTAPLGDGELVLGKYFASLAFYVLMLLPTLLYAVLFELYGNPDWGMTISTYLGLLLVGVAFTSFSLFASSLTSNQVVAWILGSVPLLLFACIAFFMVQLAEGWQRYIFQRINVIRRFDEFTRGLITVESVVFFLVVGTLFLFLAIKQVESRRWR
jgi:ABC-2 type transport system permease protein